MRNKWMRRMAALFIAALMLFGAVGCGKVSAPSFIKEYLCVEHTYGEGEIMRWATCAREGKIKFTCTECGNVKYEAIISIDHTPITISAKEPTCAQEGYTEHTACGVCGKVLSGKEIKPKLICATTSLVEYVGLGYYKCNICDNARKLQTEINVKNKDDFLLNWWYRCYFTKENAFAQVKLTNSIMPFGTYQIEGGSQKSIFDVVIVFSEGRDYVTLGNICLNGIWGYSEDLALITGADYVEMELTDKQITGAFVGDNVGTFNLSLRKDASITSTIDVKTNNSQLVRFKK